MEMGFGDLFATLSAGDKIFFGAIVAMWFLVMWFTGGEGLDKGEGSDLLYEDDNDHDIILGDIGVGLPGNKATDLYEEEEQLP